MSNFKKLVEARVAKTGESWSTAVRYIRDRIDVESDWDGVPVDGFCAGCGQAVRVCQKKCDECGWLLLDDPFECLLHNELPDRQRHAIELELTATARTGPRKRGESAEGYARRRDEVLWDVVASGSAAEAFEHEGEDLLDGDEDELAKGEPVSAQWLSAWRSARSSLATYCHTRNRMHLEEFNKHVNNMHNLDASATTREVRRMVVEIRPEWDPSSPVQPDLFGRS